MNRLRRANQKQWDSGQSDNIELIKKFSLLSLFIAMTYNILYTVLNSGDIDRLTLTIIPFIFCIIILFVFGNILVICTSFVLIGFLTLLITDYIIDYSGLIFFVIASGLNPKKEFVVGSALLSVIALSIRLAIMKSDILITTQMIFLIVFLYSCLYVVFFREKYKRVDAEKSISERDKAILKMYSNGYSYELIIRTLRLNITETTIKRIIKRVRDESPCKNDVQFGKWLFENA